MMGRPIPGREPLFYTFSMEDHVPEDHLLRGIRQLLNLSSFGRTWNRSTVTSVAPRLIRS